MTLKHKELNLWAPGIYKIEILPGCLYTACFPGYLSRFSVQRHGAPLRLKKTENFNIAIGKLGRVPRLFFRNRSIRTLSSIMPGSEVDGNRTPMVSDHLF